MKKILFAFFAVLSLCCYSAERKFPAIFTVLGELDKAKGHIQGACASMDAIYLSHQGGIFKLDLSGKLIKHISTPFHTGDICFYKGKIYSAIGYGSRSKKLRAKGEIKEYDADLNELRSYLLDTTIDGITAVNDHLYYGIGMSSNKLHRGNKIGRIPVSFSGKPEVLEIDHGYETHWGAQGLTNDGKRIFIAFYAPNKGGMAVCSQDMKSVIPLNFNASIGFDTFPAYCKAEDIVFFKVFARYKQRKKEKPYMQLKFYRYINGKMVDATMDGGKAK